MELAADLHIVEQLYRLCPSISSRHGQGHTYDNKRNIIIIINIIIEVLYLAADPTT